MKTFAAAVLAALALNTALGGSGTAPTASASKSAAASMTRVRCHVVALAEQARTAADRGSSAPCASRRSDRLPMQAGGVLAPSRTS
jgi:hypothetical protein